MLEFFKTRKTDWKKIVHLWVNIKTLRDQISSWICRSICKNSAYRSISVWSCSMLSEWGTLTGEKFVLWLPVLITPCLSLADSMCRKEWRFQTESSLSKWMALSSWVSSHIISLREEKFCWSCDIPSPSFLWNTHSLSSKGLHLPPFKIQ